MSAGRNVISQSQEWGTPKKYIDSIKHFFGGSISLDPCSNKYSIVNAEVEYRLPEKDGLVEPWTFPTIFVNPPYGTDWARGTRIRNWLFKCLEAYKENHSEVLALVPVATNTGHWKNYVWGKATAVCFLYDTRVKFLVNGRDEGKGAPMSCCLIYWGTQYESFFEHFIQFGSVCNIQNLIGHRIGEHGENTQPLPLENEE